MKTNILKISILPLVFLVAMSFTGLPPQKEKGNKGENSSEKGNQNQQDRGNNKSDNSSRGNNNNDQGRSNDDRQDNKGRSENEHQGQGKNDQDYNKNKNKDNSGDRMSKSDDHKGSDKNDKGKNDYKGKGKSHRETIKWDRDENINWGFDNYASRKRPKDHKKVNICHNTGDSEFPVTINVSENAVKAHMNHGDQMGNCTTNYSGRWTDSYIRSRETVYNNYQNTWETMSYSESLLRFAADKLLGIKSTFQTQRPTLSSQEVQRKEALILDLQNNVNSLQNQLAVTKQRTEGINININL